MSSLIISNWRRRYRLNCRNAKFSLPIAETNFFSIETTLKRFVLNQNIWCIGCITQINFPMAAPGSTPKPKWLTQLWALAIDDPLNEHLAFSQQTNLRSFPFINLHLDRTNSYSNRNSNGHPSDSPSNLFDRSKRTPHLSGRTSYWKPPNCIHN